MCQDLERNDNCLNDVLETILILQQHDDCDEDNSCSRPFLGPSNNILCLNTRPISFYSCLNNTLWEMPYTLGETTGTSNIFRIESLDSECATFRVLAPNTDTTSTFPYLSTEDFFTIKLGCIGVLNCLTDTYVNGI